MDDLLSAKRPLISTVMRMATALVTAMVISTVAAVSLQPSLHAQANGPKVEILSNAADRISGGDVLVRVSVSGAGAANPRVTVNGTDVTSQFRKDSGTESSVIGLVSGLTPGNNTLVASAAGRSTTMTIANHAITGPVFAGPKEKPFICETDKFPLQAGGMLGAATDANCSVATRVDYVYQPKYGNALKPLASKTAIPSDAATVTTSSGATVPYIVRIETGTINRGIYQIAMLHNPASEPAPDFVTPSSNWNRRLIYTFGGGCMTGWYHQATSTGGVTDDVMLRRGYAVASSTLNVAGNNCDTLLAAETMMMVKERFIEAYGVPLFTIGWGCSGGSYQVHEIADAFPGLLDGIIAGCSFPDVTHALTTTTTDSRLMGTYFAATKVPFTDEQKRAISGYVSVANMMDGYKVRAARVNATETCPDSLPQNLRYDPVKNRSGARCDIYDHAINVFGRGENGFARRPLDNVGIQYGLAALNAGVITKEQFLDLNENIGGYDEDGVAVARVRTVGDPAAIRLAYQTGRVTNGGGGLARIPIIDYRSYADEAKAGDPHLRYHSFSMRARLMKANGTVDNHVMLTESIGDHGLFDTKSVVLQEALSQMDQWLTTLSKDRSSGSPIEQIRRAKPADLTDACWTRDAAAKKIAEPQQYDSGACAKLYPPASYPRGVAGAKIDADIVKCQLKPVDAKDYRVTFSDTEKARLSAIFKGGVCDWSKPGVEQQPMAKTWPSFAAR